MTEFYTTVTSTGLEAVSKAVQSGTKIDITHMAVGDGGGVPVQPDESQTQLTNEKWRGAVSAYKQDGNSLHMSTYIPQDDSSFIIREMGVFTADGVLFAVCNTPEMRKVLPSEGAVGNFVLEMQIDISNIDMRYIEINTNPELDFVPNSEKGKPNGVAELDEDGKICKEQLPDNILITGEDGKLPDAQIPASITNHIANKQNPHGVTAAQVGAIPTAQKGAANGVATLDANRQLISSQIPTNITSHIANRQNPHGVTAAQVGAIPTTQKGTSNGVATLDGNGKLTESQIPDSILMAIRRNNASTFQNLITGRLF